ncbi:hypothetical protein KGF56_001394 [Candida oxycetoniae]|uniref:NADH:flavin oxidoreductase/NADH oxidase N-terminal domain-containing protein n=1 Tax=Candida oxycetoniae TaxID=497107 RepID=A0AAI9SZB7_9ASCO|nr:uncharacterized protein KGF56_001394 [Candida oxycetoniae]KAI3405787.2 hypothetical protein KGF56_001394 [Candida oxycetoniae]
MVGDHVDLQNQSALFKPLLIGNTQIDNRIAVSAMCTYAADPQSHTITKSQLDHYISLAKQQPGLIVFENMSVSDLAIANKCDLALWNDEQAKELAPLIDEIHELDVKCCIQLTHPGRKSIVECFAPTSIPFDKDSLLPVELSSRQIEQIIKDFVNAARRAVTICHVDYIEISCCNGNLLHQFLSRQTNQRQDCYGSEDIGKRGLFLIEMIKAIRKEMDIPIFVKLAACDNLKEGESIEDTLQLCHCLTDIVDLIDITSGGISPDSKSRWLLNQDKSIPGQVPLAEKVKNKIGNRCIVGCSGGLNRNIKELEFFVKSGKFDIAFIGKGFIETAQLMQQIITQVSS